MNKIVLAFTTLLISIITVNQLQADPSGDQPPYRIILNTEASESERWAAVELQYWLFRISGNYLPIQSYQAGYTGPGIVLGYTEEVKEKAGVPMPAFDDESFHYFSDSGNVFIYGGKERGTMYAVFTFLENEFGCRWYTPLVTVVPQKQQLVFGAYNYKSAPGIRVRNDFYYEAFDPVWSARNKMNGRMDFVKQPGGVEAFWRVHTFYPLVPPAEFYEKHPEYYSLINGKRVYEVMKGKRHELAQLCLSNKNVLKILTDRLRKHMRDQPDYRIYDVSQNDYYNPCECDKCQAIVKREGGESGLMIWFVNQVAAAVEKEFPDKYIGTLAYQYTRTPPSNIRPRHNVVVRLCPIEACVAHDLKSCEHNKSFLDDLENWAAISPQLYIWDYVVNFAHYIMPYPNFSVLQSNIKTFRDNKAIGIMEQAAYQSRGGEFAELKAYLIAKLLWNPECDTRVVVEDFINGYYGRGGRFVLEYFDLTQALVTPDTHMKIGLQPNDKMFTDDYVQKSMALFSEALKVADNETIEDRLLLTALPILYLKCMRNPVEARTDGTYAKTLAVIKKQGITHVAEYGQSMDRFRKLVEEAK